jgi:hypothetical protein
LKLNKFQFFTSAYFILFLASIGFNSFYHEETHVKNCVYRGGNVTEYELFPNPHIKCSKGASEIDAFNEGIGYQVSGFYVFVGLMGFVILVATLDNNVG